MPTPCAAPIILSERQQTALQQIVRRTTNPHRLVIRAKVVLSAASGATNTQISQQLELDRVQVRLWRIRWLAAVPQLVAAEASGVPYQHYMALINQIFRDSDRPGTPNFFSTLSVVQIVAIACETPTLAESARPVSHWTSRELAVEAIKRGIVEKISPRSVGRFLKGGYSTTTPSSLLAQCQS